MYRNLIETQGRHKKARGGCGILTWEAKSETVGPAHMHIQDNILGEKSQEKIFNKVIVLIWR